MAELDALDPVPEQVKLLSGTVVQIEDLKARQFFKFLRIVTHGALPNLKELGLFDGGDLDADEFGVRLLSLMVMSIPDAEDETLDFIRSMCKPVGLIEGRRNLTKADSERNATLWAQVDVDLDNPELDDLISIIEAIVKRESADIQALGKRLAAMFKLAEKTGQIPPTTQNSTSPTPNSSAGSAARSTSSPASTDGETTKSENSASSESDSASPRSKNDEPSDSGEQING